MLKHLRFYVLNLVTIQLTPKLAHKGGDNFERYFIWKNHTFLSECKIFLSAIKMRALIAHVLEFRFVITACIKPTQGFGALLWPRQILACDNHAAGLPDHAVFSNDSSATQA